jgi:hypothetical protein
VDFRGVVDVAALRPGVMIPLQTLPPFEEFPALGEVLNQIIERVNALIPNGGPGVKVRFTAAGFTIEAAPGQDGTAGKIQYRGDFAKGNSYTAADLTTVSLGVEAGLYIALKNVPANPTNNPIYLPWTGYGYWKLLARLTDQSQWV